MTSKLIWTNTTVALGKLKPWAHNPRFSTKAQAKRLLASWKELGQFQTVAIGPECEVYDGHQRLSALLTVYGPDYAIDARQSNRALSDEERQKLVITAHVGAVGSWDWQALAGWDTPALKEWGMDADTLKAWNTDATNLKEMLKAETAGNADAEPQIDRAEELLEKWQVKAGDLWRIGEHRLLCGDSTDGEQVERVMQGERARICFTSPPYSDQRDYHTGDFDWLALMNGVSKQVFATIGKPADVLINLGMSYKGGKADFYWNDWLAHCESLGHSLYGWYVWDKGGGMPGEWNGRLAPAHEFVFHFSVGRVSANKWIPTTGESEKRGASGKRFRQKDGSLRELSSPDTIGQPFKVPDSVIRVGREMARGVHTENHPAVFSTEFAEFGLKTWSKDGDLAFEPFAGSGTTLVACQNLARRCRAIEISPAYCAVILERMATAFPELMIERL